MIKHVGHHLRSGQHIEKNDNQTAKAHFNQQSVVVGIGFLALFVLIAVLRDWTAPGDAIAAFSSTPMSMSMECSAAPRTREGFLALAQATPGVLQAEMRGTAVATPPMPTEGIPADPVVIAAVTTTVNESTACLNAGDIPRLLALYSDNAFYLAYGGGGLGNPQEDEKALESLETPQPLPASQRVLTPIVSDVRLLPDGRVTALIRSGSQQSLTVFVESNGRYLFDWSYTLQSPATPTT
jgi:hypothetical protein